MLKGKTAVVTGASGGLGTAVVKAMIDNGARVAGVARNPQHLASTIENFNDNSRVYSADLTDEGQVAGVFQAVRRDLGVVELLVHLLGGFYGGKVKDTPTAAWRQMLELNLTSAFFCCREALKGMTGGSIVAIAAETALTPRAGVAAYAASKAGLIALMQVIAEEGKLTGVRANVIAPSVIDTEANRRAMPDAAFDKWVTPEEIAQTVVFLGSPAAGGITASVIRMPVK